MEKDIYIECLKFGYQNLDNGISYNELKEYLKIKRFQFKDEYLNVWFYNNFFTWESYNKLREKSASFQYSEGNNLDDKKHVMTFEARQKYLNHKTEESNRFLAITAIGIAVFIGLLQILLQTSDSKTTNKSNLHCHSSCQCFYYSNLKYYR